jgi:SAM-dependent methyltransferase
MLDIAKSKARDAGIANICFRQGTLDSLELEAEGFDAVLGLNILHLLVDVETTISRVNGLLKPGGIFVSSTVLIAEVKLRWRLLIQVMQLLGFAPYVNRFDKRELVSMLTNAGFSVDYEWQPGGEGVGFYCSQEVYLNRSSHYENELEDIGVLCKILKALLSDTFSAVLQIFRRARR